MVGKMIRTEPFSPMRFTSEGVIELRGKKIPYHTICEDNVFYDNEGKAIASIFSYSYFRSDVPNPAERPVLFGFNGGPGGSSVMVHAGFLGTKRIYYTEDVDAPPTLPPFLAGDNPDCLLDIADVVLVDPVGTGFGMLLDPAYEDPFYTSEGDAEALLLFVKQWLARYQRYHSPKYLVGESYGCTRAAIAAGIASFMGENRTWQIAFDGLILIGNTVTVGNYFNKNISVEPAVLQFPTCAAIHWYYDRPTGQTLEEFVDEARQFADTEYLVALYRGDSLTGEARERIKDKIRYYTGVSDAYLEKRGLRLEESGYRLDYAKKKGFMISRHDARVTVACVHPHTYQADVTALDDGVMAKYGPVFDGVLQGTIFPTLGIHTERTFVNSYRERWKSLDTKTFNTGEWLSGAMKRCPGMRTFFANGWYDLCTQAGIIYYTMNHAGLPKDRTFFKGYPSGHMLYIGEDNVKALTEDIRSFVLGKDPTK